MWSDSSGVKRTWWDRHRTEGPWIFVCCYSWVVMLNTSEIRKLLELMINEPTSGCSKAFCHNVCLHRSYCILGPRVLSNGDGQLMKWWLPVSGRLLALHTTANIQHGRDMQIAEICSYYPAVSMHRRKEQFGVPALRGNMVWYDRDIRCRISNTTTTNKCRICWCDLCKQEWVQEAGIVDTK